MFSNTRNIKNESEDNTVNFYFSSYNKFTIEQTHLFVCIFANVLYYLRVDECVCIHSPHEV